MRVRFWFRKAPLTLKEAKANRAAHGGVLKDEALPSRPGTITARVTVDGADFDFATGVYTTKGSWDAKAQEIRGRSAQVKAEKATLENIKAGLTNAFNDLQSEGVYITPERVVLQYQKPQARQAALIRVFDEFIAERIQLAVRGQLSPESVTADRVRRGLLENWLRDVGLLEIRPREFRVVRAEQFVQWMRAQGRKKNYALKVVQTYKMLLGWCVKRELLESNPLAEFRPRLDPPDDLVFLTPVELVRLWNYPFASPALRRVADCFAFACFTGLAWRDLYEFRGSRHLLPQRDGSIRLVIQRQKTGTTAIVPLLKPAADILARYGGEQLPVLSNQKFNSHLKQIASMLGMEKHLTTHVGRKTAGMILLQDGVPITIVSRVLGHRSITVTEKSYAQVLAETVTNEMSKCLGAETLGIKSVVRPFLQVFSEQLKESGALLKTA